MLLAGMYAHASVTLLMEEPYGQVSHLLNPTGHSALYFDHICADTPTVLRACREGEMGVVMSRYDDVGGYDWLAIPLIPYLYAVETAAEIPPTMDRAQEAALRDAYRRAHLESIAPDLANGTAPGSNWYELVGSSYDRAIWAFQVNSTTEQEAALVALFNDRKNKERYNGAFTNCADFARVTINRFYPHAIRRNFIADFGLTTPKSVARALTHYAKHHPEAGLRVYKIPQVAGELGRSHHIQGVAESLLKNYGVPLVLISPVTASVVLAAYVQHGRFSLPKDAPLVDFRVPESSALATVASPDAGADGKGTITIENAEAQAVERKADAVETGRGTSMPVGGPVTGSPNAPVTPAENHGGQP
ncbi:MAG TPA: hypothetical protein VGN16_13085 [Acidobacteriaceae bacterium]|jgi:hypothetical protein